MRALHQGRAVALTDYIEVARSVGLDPYAMLGQAGIDPNSLDDPEMRLPATAIVQLLEDSAIQSGTSFGMVMAERRTFASLGPIVPILERSRSLREVIDTTIDHRRTFNDVVGFRVTERAKATVIEVLMLPEFARTQAVSLLTALAYVLLRGASRGTWKPQTVHLRQDAPTDTIVFERFFSVPVQFNSNVDGFECDPLCLDQCLPPALGGTVMLIEHLEQQIHQLRRYTPVGGDEVLVALEEALDAIRSEVDLLPP